MIASDFDNFSRVFTNLSRIYGKSVDDELLQAYWNSLRDQPFATVQRRADEYIKRGKFFPKPVELRPKDTAPMVEQDERARREFEAAEAMAIKHWDERLAKDPIGTKWEILAAYEARTASAAFDDQPQERERRIEFARHARGKLLMEAPKYS